MSIRLRLTLLFSVILALTIAAFCAILYINVSRSTENFVKDDLIEEGHRLVDARQINRDRIELDTRFATPETYVQTLDAGGQLTDKTPNLGDIVLPLSTDGLSAVQNGESRTETAKIEDTRVLIYCNNNFKSAPRAFAPKAAPASLNISTYIALATYGYTNVYELGPLLDVETTKLPFEGTEVK